MRRLRKIFVILLSAFILICILIVAIMQLPSFGKNPSGERLARIQRSPNFENGQFQNRIETPMLAEDASYSKMIWEFLGNGVDREPTRPLPAVKTDLNHFPNEPTVVWFGHSSYLIYLDGKTILVDPVFSKRASPLTIVGVKAFETTYTYSLDDLPPLDLVLITHDHYDHLDYQTIKKLDQKATAFCAPLGVGSHLEHWGIDAARITELDWWETTSLSNTINIIATPARHFSGRGFIRNKTLWSSYVVRTDSTALFIGGDSGYDLSFEEIGKRFGPFDLAILECGQYDRKWPYIHMLPEETAQAAIDLQAKKLLPVHWGKFKLALHPWCDPIDRVMEASVKHNLSVVTPTIGQPVIIKAEHPSNDWWRKISSKDR